MKQILSLTLSFVLLFGMTACAEQPICPIALYQPQILQPRIRFFQKAFASCAFRWYSMVAKSANPSDITKRIERRFIMRKAFVLLLIAALSLSAIASAATYNYDNDIRFEYDENSFEITMDDHTDDEDLVILTGKEDAWGNTFIRIHLSDLDNGETFPTLEEITAALETDEVAQGDWNGYQNVFMYTVENDDGFTEHNFIAPVIDHDGEIEDVLSVRIGVSKVEDEAAAMARDDQISAVVDTLKVDD